MTETRTLTTEHPTGWTVLRVLLVLGLLGAVAVAVAAYYGYPIPTLGLISLQTAVLALSVAVAVVSIVLLFALANLHAPRRETRQVVEETTSGPSGSRSDVQVLEPEQTPRDQSVTTVPGLGAHAAERLAAIEVETLQDLVNAEPERVARLTEVDEGIARQWQRLAELMLVPGVGPRTAELLIAANVRSVDELAHARPDELQTRLQGVGRDRRVVLHEVDLGPGRVEHLVHAARRHLTRAV